MVRCQFMPCKVCGEESEDGENHPICIKYRWHELEVICEWINRRLSEEIISRLSEFIGEPYYRQWSHCLL